MDDASLFTARLCGVKDVYKVGGAQAIAAMAFGTETVPKVNKALGPGSIYVSAAKRLLYGKIDVGTPAGPSESIILCDDSINPENRRAWTCSWKPNTAPTPAPFWSPTPDGSPTKSLAFCLR